MFQPFYIYYHSNLQNNFQVGIISVNKDAEIQQG